jgi:hypothetical protein
MRVLATIAAVWPLVAVARADAVAVRTDPAVVQAARSFYKNPLRRIRRLYAKRIDEGVDYSGRGPLKALGDATITVIARGTSRFWGNVGGNVVVERMADGPLAGISVYYAETCTPDKALSVGEQVTASTTLCHVHNHFPFIEIGFAQDDLSGVPAAWRAYRKFPDGSKTAYGVDFSRLLGDLGAPQGNTNGGTGDMSYRPSKTVGRLPQGFPRF